MTTFISYELDTSDWRLATNMYLLIDNYDSFTYNLYQAFAEEGINLLIKRNDEITLKEIELLRPEKIIISPGPKTPKEAGISVNVIKQFWDTTPILGICLGHQCIAKAFGGKISRIRKIVHGKTTLIHHNNKGIFKNMPNPFPGARYHSLITPTLPDSLMVTARTKNKIIMGIQHKTKPVIGLQFHPESFLTKKGTILIKNFINL